MGVFYVVFLPRVSIELLERLKVIATVDAISRWIGMFLTTFMHSLKVIAIVDAISPNGGNQNRHSPHSQ